MLRRSVASFAGAQDAPEDATVDVGCEHPCRGAGVSHARRPTGTLRIGYAAHRGGRPVRRARYFDSWNSIDDTQPLLPSSSSTSHMAPSLVPVG